MKILLILAGGIVKMNRLSPQDTLIRCQKGLQLWQSGNYDYLLVTGGLFNPKTVQTITAAGLMRKWFVKNGVAKEKILIEADSRDTYQNVAFSIRLLKTKKIDKPEITIVSQWQHNIRIKRTFRSYGYQVKTHNVKYPVGWKTWLMEWAFIMLHFISPKGNNYWARKNQEKRKAASLEQ